MNCPTLKQKYTELLVLSERFEHALNAFKDMKSKTPAERQVVEDELNELKEEIEKMVFKNFASAWKDAMIGF